MSRTDYIFYEGSNLSSNSRAYLCNLFLSLASDGPINCKHRSGGTNDAPDDGSECSDPLSVQLDGMELQQVLLNLVRNAIDAMRSSPPEERRLRLKTSFDGQSTVSMSVQDSGPGIPAEDRQRIFDPFFTTKPGGMGLGLAISSTLVANHGGKLRLVKSDAEGSAFELEMPVGKQRSVA